MKVIIVLIAVFPFFCSAQSWQWANNGGGTTFDRVEPSCITTDNAGNTYVTGSFYGTMTIDSIQLTSNGWNKDIFWAKFDKNGHVVWAKSTGGRGEDWYGGIAVDKACNVYVFLSYTDTIINSNFQLYNSGFRSDLLLIKYDSSGNYLTHKTWGTPFEDKASSIAINQDGQIYLYGTFAAYNGSAVPPDSLRTLVFGASYSILSKSRYGRDFFLAAFDSSFSPLFAKAGLGSCLAYNRLSVDKDKNITITGMGFDKIWFDNISLTGSMSGIFLFVAKYDSSGNALWARMGKAANGGNYWMSCIAGSDGSVYCAGTYDASSIIGGITAIDFGGPHYLHDDNAFIIKFDPNGIIVWAKNIGVTARDAADDIAIDSADNIYVTGTFDWWGKFGNDTIYTKGADDIYVNKYDKNGNYIWTATAGGATNDGGYAITVGADQNIYVGGYISSVPASFGSHQVSSNGAWDMCVAKLSPTPTTVKEVTAKANDIRIAPNPNNGSFSVFIKQGNYQTLQLVDVMGKVVHEQSVSVNQQDIITINAKLSSGMYFIKLSGKDGVVSKKMMVE